MLVCPGIILGIKMMIQMIFPICAEIKVMISEHRGIKQRERRQMKPIRTADSINTRTFLQMVATARQFGACFGDDSMAGNLQSAVWRRASCGR